MQREREGRNDDIHSGRSFDGFGGFSGFGSQRSMMSGLFGGRDPFDDPFFTRPLDGVFGSSIFGSSGPLRDEPRSSRSKGPVIEELHTDDEEEEGNDPGSGNMKDKAEKSTKSRTDPFVEHPEDQVNEEKSKDVRHRSDHNKFEGTRPRTQGTSFRKVTYGGINGAYYTATTTRRAGSDGVVLEESRQADKTTGEAAHRISRGIHDKGHYITRKLGSDGKVDTLQALHNLNEDELSNFDQAWKGNAERNFPGWSAGLNIMENARDSGSRQSMQVAPSGWALPSMDHSRRTAAVGGDNESRMSSSGRRPKKVVTINIV